MRKSVARNAIAENCSQHLDLIDEDKSGDLDAAEVETLLAAMGITGPERQKILVASLNGNQNTTEERVTEAILIHADIKESKLQVMLGRVALFGKVFRWLDFDGDGTLCLPEVLRMMELLNIDLKLAADLMAFLDTDDSGEITWQEFVRGICTEEFSVLFPQITLEALVELPSSLQQNKLVSAEEERQAIAELPSIEKSLYWVMSIMYGSAAEKLDKENSFDLDLTEIPARFKASKDAATDTATDSPTIPGSPTNAKVAWEPAQPKDDLQITEVTHPHAMAAMADVHCLVVRREHRTATPVRPAIIHPKLPDEDISTHPHAMSVADVRCLVVRREPRNPTAVRPAIIHPKLPDEQTHTHMQGVRCFVVRKEPRTATAVRPAVIHAKLPDAELQWVQFPEAQKPRTPNIPEAMPCMEIEPEKPQEKQRKISNSSYGQAAAVLSSALSGLSGVATGVANGLASAFGLPSKDSNKRPRMSVAEAANVIKSMTVKKAGKAHVLNEQKRRSLWRCRYAAILTGVLAGVGAAFLAQLLNDYTSTLVDEDEDYIMWNVVAGSFSLLWSLAEMIVCCIAALVATVRMTRICGMILVPMDKERAMLAGSLARSALELGHPKVRTFGIDPYKRANKYLLLIYALIYMGSRGITKFIAKLLMKKVAPRTLLKVTKFAPLLVEVLINVLFNSVTVNYAMNEVMICSLGPSATIEVTSQLIKARRHSENVEEPLSDEVKLLALRAVGVSISYKMQLHPNSRFLLNHIVGLFADPSFVKRAKEEYFELKGGLAVQRTKGTKSHRSHASQQSRSRKACCFCSRKVAEVPAETLHEELADLGLDEEDLFFDGLTGLSHRDALFACSMLVLALMLDGRISRADWKFIQRAAGSARPPLEAKWSSTVYLVNMYNSGRQMNAEMFHQIFETSKGADGIGAASCCDYVTDVMRTILEYTNCC